MPEENLGNYEDAKEYPVIPEGEYVCMIESVEERVKEDTGNKVWKLTMSVIGGDFAGQKIFDNLTWTAKAMGRVKVFFRALGHDVDKKESVKYDTEMARGKKVRVSVHVRNEEYKGVFSDKTKVDFAGYGKPEDGQMRDGELPKDDEDLDVPF